MITRNDLQVFFDNTRQLRETGKADFDIDDVCRWSYFFTDPLKSNLTRLGLHLEDNGYKIFGFLEANDDETGEKNLFIRADRIEKHTVDSLLETNEAFYVLVEKMGVEEYDGMDVGPITRA